MCLDRPKGDRAKRVTVYRAVFATPGADHTRDETGAMLSLRRAAQILPRAIRPCSLCTLCGPAKWQSALKCSSSSAEGS
ncbi:hypothetical protein AAFF_G00030780 [Aldrovandia affinis]|uniref:Uncharacterized protein n=1 Tax=Aldrovandia affinis TaxID=143900 RepID=A0AAD7S451_9TELE|nr:hypothetical protein AAFF_G00030780 [Aldrovandia affinis]